MIFLFYEQFIYMPNKLSFETKSMLRKTFPVECKNNCNVTFLFVSDIFVSVSHFFALVLKILATPKILETVIDKQFDCSQNDGE